MCVNFFKIFFCLTNVAKRLFVKIRLFLV